MPDAALEEAPPSNRHPAARGPIRGPRNFTAGSALVGIALFVFWAAGSLDTGTLRAVGPGFMPRVVAVIIAAFGIGIAISGLVKDGDDLERWGWRGPLFVCVGILAFAATIRTTGLALAGPLIMIIGGYASPEARFKELVLFSVVITVACAVLFRFVLGLSIPVLIIPGVIFL